MRQSRKALHPAAGLRFSQILAPPLKVDPGRNLRAMQ
jgi:hypothetical protein